MINKKMQKQELPTKSTVVPDYLKKPVAPPIQATAEIFVEPTNLQIHSIAEAKSLIDGLKSLPTNAITMELQKKLNNIITYFKSNDRVSAIRKAAAARNERTRREHKQ